MPGVVAQWIRRQIELEERARTGMVLFPLAMIGAIVAVYVGGLRPTVAVVSVFGAAALLFAYVPKANGPLRILGVLLLGTAAGLAACVIELARTDTTIFSGEATVRIEGRVLVREQDERGRYRYTIDIERTERPTLSRPPDRARIVVSSRHEPLAIGSTYSGLVRLRPPAGPAFPGAYDFAFTPYFSGLGAYGYSLGAPLPSKDLRDPTFSDRIARLRLSMGDSIRDAIPGPTGTVAAALITGERAGIPEEINEDLRITGLAHVLSISGFHMALVAGFFMLAVRATASLVPPLALRWSVKKIAAVVALLGSAFYFLLAGDNAATERSFIMIAVMLGAVLLDKPALTLRNVAIAAIIVLASSPHAALTATFQMSFAATAALIGAYGAYTRWQRRRSDARPHLKLRTLGLILLGMALSSAIAGAATAPFSTYHFQRAAPFALVANVIATPLFSFWIMPAGLLAVLAMPFGLHEIFLKAMGVGLDLVFVLASRLADAFPDYPTGQMSGLALLLLSAAILLFSFSASQFKWIGVPIVVVGLFLSPVRMVPELLVFEDGKEVALLDSGGRLVSLKPNPSSFVWDQWGRAYSAEIADQRGAASEDGLEQSSFRCVAGVCRARTRSGFEIGWTDDYTKLEELCRTSDVAVVARAVRQERCDAGAHLVTLRTLRRSGSLAIYATPGANAPTVVPSMDENLTEWNAHRREPWPEYWRKPEGEASALPSAESFDAAGAVSDTAGSDRQGVPEP